LKVLDLGFNCITDACLVHLKGKAVVMLFSTCIFYEFVVYIIVTREYMYHLLDYLIMLLSFKGSSRCINKLFFYFLLLIPWHLITIDVVILNDGNDTLFCRLNMRCIFLFRISLDTAVVHVISRKNIYQSHKRMIQKDL
jgi:hypothetical protein